MSFGVNPRELAHLFTDMVLGSALDPMERQERFLPDEFIAIFKLLFWHLGYRLEERR